MKLLNRYTNAPWLLAALVLLAYTGWRSFHLVELLAWQLGAIALAPPVAVALWKWLNPGRSLKKLTRDEAVHARWQIVVLVAAIILAIAMGV